MSDRRQTADHWQPQQLISRIPQLLAQAAAEGVAGESLGQFARHAAGVTVRTASGVAELHRDFADLFVILDGAATLVSGGVLAGAENIADGETRGPAIEGGKTIALRPGDVVHIAAGIPHQMLLDTQQSVTYFVMKIQESF